MNLHVIDRFARPDAHRIDAGPPLAPDLLAPDPPRKMPRAMALTGAALIVPAGLVIGAAFGALSGLAAGVAAAATWAAVSVEGVEHAA